MPLPSASWSNTYIVPDTVDSIPQGQCRSWAVKQLSCKMYWPCRMCIIDEYWVWVAIWGIPCLECAEKCCMSTASKPTSTHQPLNWVRVLVWVENLYPDPDPSTTQHETQQVYPTCYNAYMWCNHLKLGFLSVSVGVGAELSPLSAPSPPRPMLSLLLQWVTQNLAFCLCLLTSLPGFFFSFPLQLLVPLCPLCRLPFYSCSPVLAIAVSDLNSHFLSVFADLPPICFSLFFPLPSWVFFFFFLFSF